MHFLCSRIYPNKDERCPTVGISNRADFVNLNSLFSLTFHRCTAADSAVTSTVCNRRRPVVPA